MLLQKSVPSESISLSSITTDKFKTGLLSFSVTLKNERLTSPYALLLTELLQRATESYPKKALLQRKLDELYSASVSIRCLKAGKNRMFHFSAEILDNSYTDSTDVASETCFVLYELMLRPLLDENGLFAKDSVEREKRRVITYLKSAINNPSRYATIRLSEMLRRSDETLMTLEEMIDAVEKCDAASLTDFYRSSLVGRPVEVFYIGSLSHEEIEERVMSCFASHKPENAKAVTPLCAVYPERECQRKEEAMPISQGRLSLGFRSDVMPDSEDYYAMVIFNELFGGSPASKLFMNVRERMSLCYSCSSYYNPTTGSVRVNAGISSQNREIAERAILEEFANIQNGKISKRELLCAKNAVANSYREIYDCPADIASFYLNRTTFGVVCTIDECREKFSRISADDVIRVANRIKLDSVYFLRADGTPENDGEEEDDE